MRMGKVSFTELSVFLNTAERQRVTANEAHSQFILECLETTLLSLFGLMEMVH